MADVKKFASTGLAGRDGPLILALLQRGYPLRALLHMMKRVDGSVWQYLARGLADARNGDGPERLDDMLDGIYVQGFKNEIETRRYLLDKIQNVTPEDIEQALTDDEELKRRRLLKRHRFDNLDKVHDIEWLWPGWIPRGYLSMVAGYSGVGKSHYALWFANMLLKGGTLPDGTVMPAPPACTDPTVHRDCECPMIMWLDTENTYEMLRLRMRDFGTPGTQVIYPPGDTPETERVPLIDLLQDKWKQAIADLAMDERKLCWIVIDSLRGSHTGKEKDDAVMQPLMAWAAGLATDLRIGLTFLHHLRKLHPGETTEVTLDRVRGSTAITAMMRSIVALDEPDTHLKGQKRMHVIKSNLAAKPDPYGFQIQDEGICLSEVVPEPHNAVTALERAVEFLEGKLLDGEACHAMDLLEDGRMAGISQAAMTRAAKLMKVDKFRKAGCWWWKLTVKEEE